MAGRSIDIPARQITAICRGAAKAGYVPLLQIGKVLVRLVPDVPKEDAQPERRIDEKVEIRF